MYGIFDVGLISDLPLPELPLVTSASTVLQVARSSGFNEAGVEPPWFHHWNTPGGAPLISCARLGERILLRFPGPIDFLISLRERRIEYWSGGCSDVSTLRHYLLDQVVPRVLGQLGRLVLHASAVRLHSGRCVAFLGDSGAGKSTMAASFQASGKGALLTDDCLVADIGPWGVSVIPAYQGLRLHADAAVSMEPTLLSTGGTNVCNGKLRYRATTESASSGVNMRQLAALFILAESTGVDGICIEPLRGSRSLMAVMQQMFILDIEDHTLVALQLANKGRLLSSGLPVYSLSYPRDLAQLPQIRERINDLLA